MTNTAYVDFEFYTNEYGGTAIVSASFNRLARQASLVIDQVTFERAYDVIDADIDTELIEKIKLATCAIAEELKSQEDNGIKNVASESVGSHSVSYVVNADVQRTKNSKLVNAAKLYLSSTGLMFGGFYASE